MTEVACRIPVRDVRSQSLALREEKALASTAKRERSERHTGYAVYWMYLLSPFTAGISALVGLLMASAKGTEASEVPATHFRFQVWSFWSAFLAALTGGGWAAVGGIASVAGFEAGSSLALAGGALAAVSGIGFFGASLFGLTKLASKTPLGWLPRA